MKKREKWSFIDWDWIITIILFQPLIWFASTVLWWVLDYSPVGSKRSLWEIIKAQYHFII